MCSRNLFVTLGVLDRSRCRHECRYRSRNRLGTLCLSGRSRCGAVSRSHNPLSTLRARSYEVLRLSREIILANLKVWCSKMQPLSGHQRPDLLTCLMEMSLVLHMPRDMHLCRSSLNFPCLPPFWKLLQSPHVWLTVHQVQNPLRLPHTTTLERPKVVRACDVFSILTWKCASRHNAVHFCSITTPNFQKCADNQWCVLRILASKCASRHNGVHCFNISMSKSAPRMVCFQHFDFKMCFAPQRCALFQQLNFQKCTKPAVFLPFSLPHVLRATRVCTFSIS